MTSADEYDVFMYKGTWRAGMRHLQDKKDHMLWVPVVRVADLEVIVKNGLAFQVANEPPRQSVERWWSPLA